MTQNRPFEKVPCWKGSFEKGSVETCSILKIVLFWKPNYLKKDHLGIPKISLFKKEPFWGYQNDPFSKWFFSWKMNHLKNEGAPWTSKCVEDVLTSLKFLRCGGKYLLTSSALEQTVKLSTYSRCLDLRSPCWGHNGFSWVNLRISHKLT